ncbi:MAG: cytochrome c1 [Campylobacterales bacterium]|nr:cytochrome c1 [Campylobacterales bacterium]
MKKELLILAVVVAFSLLTYWLVEPYAHSVMHPHVQNRGFQYDGTADIEEMQNKISALNESKAAEEAKEMRDPKAIANIEADLVAAKTRLETKISFWKDIKRIAALPIDINLTAGEAAYQNCLGCHMEGAAAMGGVIPPRLESAGAIYDRNYLIGLIKDPAMVSNVDHKFSIVRHHEMESVKYMVSTDEDIVNVIAYLQSIAPKAEEITPKVAFEDSCGRCHSVKYKAWTVIGEKPRFKLKKDDFAFELKKYEYEEGLTQYMGKLPPDLSMYIRSRGPEYISAFMEDPQQLLAGTSMPRVGINADTAEKVVEYLVEAGDPKHEERDRIGMYVMIYMIFFVIAAYLWKRQIWKDLH